MNIALGEIGVEKGTVIYPDKGEIADKKTRAALGMEEAARDQESNDFSR
jgi:hypothetical protein